MAENNSVFQSCGNKLYLCFVTQILLLLNSAAWGQITYYTVDREGNENSSNVHTSSDSYVVLPTQVSDKNYISRISCKSKVSIFCQCAT